MQRILGRRTLFIAVGVFVAAQHMGFSKADDKLGSIEGKVENGLLRSNPAVVYVADAPGDFPPPKEPAVMDQEKLTFIPKVLPILVGSTVNCPNNDKVQHNIFSPPKSAKQFNLGLYPPGASKDLVFEKPGVVPLLCNVHAEMSGFIVVLPNPYFAATDKEGTFKIEDVPAGKYKLTFWHEKLRPKTVDVTVTAGKTSKASFSGLSRGKYSVELVK
jgi:plastocyanin